MSDPTASLNRAAHNVLTRSLGLRRDQNLLIFADPDALEVVEIMTRAARELGITASALFVPRSLQAETGRDAGLPLPVEAAMREADAVLSCLSDRPEHMAYRMRVLQSGWSRRTRLAHAPGMTAAILRMADTDYDEIAGRAGLLALALILGRRLEIVTTDSRKADHRLTVRLGGWNYPPGISDGVIPNGAWGSLPPGEVYIAPRGGDGEIVINGALPGKVLSAAEELIVVFQDGRLTNMRPQDGPAARHLQRTQIAYAERRGDPNWPNLAEIGFGLNLSVGDLTGVSVVDEKKAHTVHVALGHSTHLGGDVDSCIHCDLVLRKPTVYVNGHLIMKAGDWRLNESDWRLDHRSVAVPAGWWEGVTVVGRSGGRSEREDGRLLCAWNAGRGRWDHAAVGVESTARLAARLYDLLPDNGDIVPVARLAPDAAAAGIPAVGLPGLLWVMHQFDLVRLPGAVGAG